ncbi:MAG: response regulator [Bacteroidota bacterium]
MSKRARKVLIIDDSAFMRSGLRAFMLRNDFEVVGEAKNGEEGIDLALELEPDIITLDNILPDMTGLEVLKSLKKQNVASAIIMISAVGQQSAIEEAKSHGALEYLIKPYDEGILLEKMSLSH